MVECFPFETIPHLMIVYHRNSSDLLQTKHEVMLTMRNFVHLNAPVYMLQAILF